MVRTFPAVTILLVAFSIVSGACARVPSVETPRQINLSQGISRPDVFVQTNAVRSEKKLKPLAENPLLQAVAQAKAEDMAKRGWFSHTSPEGAKAWPSVANAGYAYSLLGENLAAGFNDSTSTVAAWVRSPTHYDNIVDKDFRDTGIGIASGDLNGKRTTFVVQLFGLKRK